MGPCPGHARRRVTLPADAQVPRSPSRQERRTTASGAHPCQTVEAGGARRGRRDRRRPAGPPRHRDPVPRQRTAGHRHADADPDGHRPGWLLADQDRDRDRRRGARPRRWRAAATCPRRRPSRSRSSIGRPHPTRSSRRTPPTPRRSRPRAARSRCSSTSRPRRRRSRTSSSWPSRGISTGSSSRGSSIRSTSCRRATRSGTGAGGPGYAIPDELGGKMHYAPGHDRDGQRRPEHRREPVLPHHRSGGREPRRQPELHDLRAGDRRASTSPSRSTG